VVLFLFDEANASLSPLLPLPASSVPGLLLMGYLSDHIPLRIVITVSALGSALSCLFLWGFASHSGGLLVAFAITFGLLALSFTAIWAKLISVISSESSSMSNPVRRGS
jgi:MFS family permease